MTRVSYHSFMGKSRAFFGIFLLLTVENQDFETTFTAVAATINNIGPGFGLVGPAESFALFSPFGKLLLSFSMLLGRLELWPILLTFYPAVWKSTKLTEKGSV